jgi:hypothetical protein
MTDVDDIRGAETTQRDVAAFIASHHVKRIVRPDRILGCPHQEGIDYPMGRHCPHCPFWVNVDRFTHDPVRVAVPSVSPDDVLTTLARGVPDALDQALASADGHREVLVERLLEALERGLADPQNASKEEASLFLYALYLLAKWREPRAYPYVIRWLSLPDEQPFDIAGDTVTQDGGRILAGVCDGNLEPIMSLVVNRQADTSSGVGRSPTCPGDRTALVAGTRRARTTRECGVGLPRLRMRGHRSRGTLSRFAAGVRPGLH